MSTAFPRPEIMTIGFAHAAYRLGEAFARRNTGIRHWEVRTLDELKARAGEADVLVVSGLWRNEILVAAPKLRFVQSISAGVDQYDKAAFAQRGVRLASAQGANAQAVAEHAMALMLAVSRRLGEAARHQATRHWRPMISDRSVREFELAGRTLLVVGLGGIGGRLAHMAKAFGMRVVGLRRDPAAGKGAADAVHPMAELHRLLPEADMVALTCPLTPETTNLIDAAALARMKASATLVNVARGKVVDEPALIAALEKGAIAAAGLDCTVVEPLPADSKLWAMPQVVITPHTGGETARYEDNIVDLLMDNLGRLGRGEAALKNQIV